MECQHPISVGNRMMQNPPKHMPPHMRPRADTPPQICRPYQFHPWALPSSSCKSALACLGYICCDGPTHIKGNETVTAVCSGIGCVGCGPVKMMCRLWKEMKSNTKANKSSSFVICPYTLMSLKPFSINLFDWDLSSLTNKYMTKIVGLEMK